MPGLKRLFEVTVALPPGHIAASKVWLVLADREDEARALVPAESAVELVRATPGLLTARGPSRVIGWTTSHAT